MGRHATHHSNGSHPMFKQIKTLTLAGALMASAFVATSAEAAGWFVGLVDVKTGQATMKSKLSESWKAGVTTTFDFNPVADRLRLMSSEGVSFRVNVDDGKVTVDGSHK